MGFKQKVKRSRGFCLNYDQSIGKTLKKNMFFQHTEKKIVFFHGHFCSFTGIASCFFHVHEFEFHGQNLMKNFTGTFLFSRALFNVFSGFFTGTVFFFHGKKKTLSIFLSA